LIGILVSLVTVPPLSNPVPYVILLAFVAYYPYKEYRTAKQGSRESADTVSRE
jgi:hypothetical protein